jgi:16S rRNA (guanine1207-N2)-methyltransferase
MGPGHYFDADPAVPSRPAAVELTLPDFHARLAVDRGVFAGAKIDPGTLELLRASPAPPARGHLLDLGCGYGAIACTLAHRAPGTVVWAVDVNERALDLTARNAAALSLPAVRAVRPDGVPASVRFAGVWSNPPIRIGKAGLHELLGTWLVRLDTDARAWLVVHRHLGGDSLATWLRNQDWTVHRAASKRGYRILEVSRP